MRRYAASGLLIAVAIMLVAGPAIAQSINSQMLEGPGKSKEQIEQEKILEQQYKESLKAIPDGKASNDPWSNIRGTEADATPKPVKPVAKPKSAAKPSAAKGAAAAAPSPWPAPAKGTTAAAAASPWPAPTPR
jgi:hypothetical protein